MTFTSFFRTYGKKALISTLAVILFAAPVTFSVLYAAPGSSEVALSKYSAVETLSALADSHDINDEDAGENEDQDDNDEDAGENEDQDDNDEDAGTSQTNTFEVPNPLQSEDLAGLINSIINVLILLAAPITVIMVVYAGFLYVTSAGNEDKIKTANKTIAYAAIGFAILLISKSVVVIIDDVLSGSTSSTQQTTEVGDGLPTEDEGETATE